MREPGHRAHVDQHRRQKALKVSRHILLKMPATGSEAIYFIAIWTFGLAAVLGGVSRGLQPG